METAIERGDSLNFMFSWFQKWEKNSLLADEFRSLAAAVDDTYSVFFTSFTFLLLKRQMREEEEEENADFTLFIINIVWSFVLVTIIPIKHIHRDGLWTELCAIKSAAVGATFLCALICISMCKKFREISRKWKEYTLWLLWNAKQLMRRIGSWTLANEFSGSIDGFFISFHE